MTSSELRTLAAQQKGKIMMRIFDYLYIFATIGFTVYRQLILKWRIPQHSPLPIELADKLKFLFGLLLDPAIFSRFAAAFIASFAWIATKTKFDLSHAYPFMSLNFVVVLLLSDWLLSKPMTAKKSLAVDLIVVGTLVASRD